MAAMRDLQESAHLESHDYRAGSPHLKHWHLYQRMLGAIREVLTSLQRESLPWSVLDVGAGHGSFTEPLLAYGCTVTASEMSRPSIEVLRTRYGSNERFSAILEEDGSLNGLGDRDFSLVLFASVLHHIPDYAAAIDAGISRLVPGGALVTFQDPLWYTTMGRSRRLASQFAYFWWRLGQGNYRRGLRTRWRRTRGLFDERNPSDSVEYNVVRRGVDQDRLVDQLRARFQNVTLIRYWSTQSSLWQLIGESVGAENTFGIVATNRVR